MVEDGAEELEDLVHFSVSELPSRGYGVMEEIRRQGKLCDVTLKIGDHKFSAHRIVLAASIPYFHAMFTNDMMECKQDEIVMQGMDPRFLKLHWPGSGMTGSRGDHACPSCCPISACLFAGPSSYQIECSKMTWYGAVTNAGTWSMKQRTII